MYNHLLDTFIRAADLGSFTKAATSLYTTTVSVMNQINALEKETGVTLFTRTHHGVRLTEAGVHLYEAAKEIMALSDRAIDEARHIEGTAQATIRIGTSLLRPCRRLMDYWTAHDTGTQPFQIQVIPFEDDPASMTNMFKSLGKDIDCFVSPCDSRTWQENYAIYPLRTCTCCIAMSRRHSLAQKENLTWSDLDGETLMLLKPGESPALDALRQEIETNHPAIQLVDLENFYNIAVFNECDQKGYLLEVPDTWTHVHPSIVTRPVTNWHYTMPFGIVYSRHPSRAFAQFLHCLDDYTKA